MNHIYEIDKITILERIEAVTKTISDRLLPTFENIETEAKELSERKLQELSRHFNPDTMDESVFFEQAYHRGVDHYIIQEKMKIEFLKSSITWLFHLFEKDCTYIFNTEDGDQKRHILTTLEIDVSNRSNWYKCNKELRYLANSIKHGKGSSFEKLKELRPDLINESDNLLSNSSIIVDISVISDYSECIKSFWNILFDKILNV